MCVLTTFTTCTIRTIQPLGMWSRVHLKLKGEPKDVEKLFTPSHEKQPEVSQPTKKRKLDVINVNELDVPDSFSNAPATWLTCANIGLLVPKNH